MILVDERDGSRELISRLGDLALPCYLNNDEGVAVGDAAFHGNGPTGDISIGVEVKRMSDLLTSEMDGRLLGVNGQIPRMLKHWDRVWLLSIGPYRLGAHGNLEILRHDRWRTHKVHGSRPAPYGYLEAFLVELAELGVHHKHVYDYDEAAAWLKVNYRFYDKPYSAHRATRKTHNSGGVLLPGLDANTEQMVRTFQTFPGVGFERALSAARVFPSVEAGCLAPEREWCEVPGIGKVFAKAIRRAVKGEL